MADVDRLADLGALEHELQRIPGVSAVRVVVDGDSKPIEIHVLASLTRHAKQLVRDVQSVAKAGFDVDIDRRIVSIVQLDGPAGMGGDGDISGEPSELDDDSGPGLDPKRVVVDGVSINRNGPRAIAQVRLGRNGAQALGTAEGAASTVLLPALVARATLDALSFLEANAGRLEIEGATVQQVGDRSVALVSLVLLGTATEESLLGAAMVRHAGFEDAVVRSVLNAVNRRLAFA
jgi:hypothetical protein